MSLVTVVREDWAGSLVHSIGSNLVFDCHDAELLPARDLPINFVLGTFEMGALFAL